MTRNLLSCRRWFLASHLARSGIWGSVCVLCLNLLAWHLKITQHSQQTSKQRIFSKEREKKWQNNTFASNVYICVLVFIINQHNGWKVLIYEIQIKKIHYVSMSFLKGMQLFYRFRLRTKINEKIPIYFLTALCKQKVLEITL